MMLRFKRVVFGAKFISPRVRFEGAAVAQIQGAPALGVKANHLFAYSFTNLLQLERDERAPFLLKYRKRAKDSEIVMKCTTVMG
jgi:hypothetical protein